MFNAVNQANNTEGIENALANHHEVSDSAQFKIKLDATHSVLTNMRLPELRFDKRSCIKDVKSNLEMRFGTEAANQTL
jgi:hypothetical protein